MLLLGPDRDDRGQPVRNPNTGMGYRLDGRDPNSPKPVKEYLADEKKYVEVEARLWERDVQVMRSRALAEEEALLKAAAQTKR